LEQAGFHGIELVSETGFNSSPVTKGVLFRAAKSEHASQRKDDAMQESPFDVTSPGFT